jgi:hypothetical protein
MALNPFVVLFYSCLLHSESGHLSQASTFRSNLATQEARAKSGLSYALSNRVAIPANVFP